MPNFSSSAAVRKDMSRSSKASPPAKRRPLLGDPLRLPGLSGGESNDESVTALLPKSDDADKTDLMNFSSVDELLAEEPAHAAPMVDERSLAPRGAEPRPRTSSGVQARVSRAAPVEAPEAGLVRRPSQVDILEKEGGRAKLDTALWSLSPTFMKAIRGVAPKKKGVRFPWVEVLIVALLAGILGADPSTREFVVGKVTGVLHIAPQTTGTLATP